jgi:hypothetical protein
VFENRSIRMTFCAPGGIMRGFKICTPRQILLEWTYQGGWNGWSIWHACARTDMPGDRPITGTHYACGHKNYGTEWYELKKKREEFLLPHPQSKWHFSTADVQYLIYEQDSYSTHGTYTHINISVSIKINGTNNSELAQYRHTVRTII